MSDQNRITDRGYTGSLVFYKNLEIDCFGVSADTEETFRRWNDDRRVFLGTCDVNVKFDVDTREAEITALERERETLRAEMGRKLAFIEERISNLRALPGSEVQK